MLIITWCVAWIFNKNLF